jgi:hypothetical protein
MRFSHIGLPAGQSKESGKAGHFLLEAAKAANAKSSG